MSKNGLILLTPTSIAYTGTSASISANGSVSFTACSSVSLNGVFSADYDNYMMVIRSTRASSVDPFSYRLRASGTDASGNDYVNQRILVNGGSTSGFRTTLTYARSTDHTTGMNGRISYFYSPYTAQPTAIRSVGISNENGAILDDFTNMHTLSNSYDGITCIDFSSTGTGRIAVYGMRK